MDYLGLLKEYHKSIPKNDIIEYGTWFEPYSLELQRVVHENKLNNTPASFLDIQALEDRLKVQLPPSYKEFLEFSNGLLLPTRFTNLLPVSKVEWFYNLNREWVESWCKNEENIISDEEYFVYGEEQDSCTIRASYLKSALQISDSLEGEVLLLNPKVKFGEEWEAWWFSNSHPGALRFKSFKELLEFLIQEDINYYKNPKNSSLEERHFKEIDIDAMIDRALQELLESEEGEELFFKEFQKEKELVEEEIKKLLYKKDIF